MKFSRMILLLLGGSRVATTFTTRPRALTTSQILIRQLSATVEPTATKEEVSATKLPDMEEIVSLCKRRGIIFPSSEIYNGFAGFFDYGPLGAELKRNIKDAWWRNFVTQREDVVGLDSSIIHNPTTWKSSGTFLVGYQTSQEDSNECPFSSTLGFFIFCCFEQATSMGFRIRW